MSVTPLPKTPGVYVIVNTSNHHCYVGSTQNFAKRYREHFRRLERGDHHSSHLQAAYNLYGPSVFAFHILEHVSNLDDLIQREQHYIDLCRPEYNTAPQAGRVTGIKRSSEQIAKLTAAAAVANRVREYPKHSPEYIARHSALFRAKVASGEYVSPTQGKNLAAEHRAKLSVAARGRKLSPASVEKREAVKRSIRALQSEYGISHISRKPSSDEIACRVSTRRIRQEAGLYVSQKGRKIPASVIAKRVATRKANREAKLLAQQQEDMQKFITSDSSVVNLDITSITPQTLWDAS